MSLYAATEGNYAQITGLSLPSTAAFCACGFWMPTTTNSDYQVSLSVENATTQISVTPVSGGQQATLFVSSTGQNYNTTEAFIVGRWHFFAFGQIGGDIYFGMTPYIGRYIRIATATSIATFSPTIVRVGGFGASSDYHAPGHFAGMRYWSRFRGPQEIVAEARSLFPVDRNGLEAAWPLTPETGLRDVSGRGRHLSLVNTPVVTGQRPEIRAPRRRSIISLGRTIKTFAVNADGAAQGRVEITPAEWANVSQWPWTPRVRVVSESVPPM